MSVGVRQHTHDVRGCPSAHIGHPWLSVCVCVGQLAHKGRPWLSISTHISTLVLGLSTLTIPVDCSGDFGPHGLSVQYTQDVCGCPSAHTGRLWLSVCVRQHTQDVRGCPSVHISARWSLDSARWPFPWTVWVILAHVGCLFSTHRTSVGNHQHTQDVCGCLSAHTRRLLLSVCIRVCLWVSASTHRTSVAVRQHTQDFRVSTLRPSLGLLGDSGARGLFVQYTWKFCVGDRQPQQESVAVRQHTPVRLWLFRVCPCVDIVAVHQYPLSTWPLPVTVRVIWPRGLSIHYTHAVMGVLQHTKDIATKQDPVRGLVPKYKYQHVVHWTLHADPSRAHTMASWCPSVHILARWSLDSARWPFPWTVWVILAHVGCLFSTHRTSVGVRQHTHDVCGCPSAHTGHPWLSICVRVCKSAHTGRPWLSISTHISTLVLGLSTLTIPVDCSGDFSPRGLSVQYTQDVSHTGCPWLSISTHISPLVLGLSTLAFPVDCLGDFGPRGLFVQYTQDVHGYPPAHTGCLWLFVSTHKTSVAVRVCSCVSVGVRQHTQDVRGCPLAHIGRPCVSVSTHMTYVAVRVCPSAHTGHLWLSIRSSWVSASTHRTSVAVRQHTQYVCGCPCVPVWTSVAIRVRVDIRGCPSAHTGRLWLSNSTHISTLVLGLSTLALPVDCLGDFGPRGLPVQYTQDVRGCPPAHTGLSVRVCPSTHTGRPWLSISTHISVLVLGLSTLALPVDCSGDFGPRGLCVQFIQDVRGCPSAYTGRPFLSISTHKTSVAVCVCSSAHIGRPWLFINTHIITLVLGLSTLTIPVDYSGDFGPRGVFVQYTQDFRGYPPAHTQDDVRGCPSAHIGLPCVSVSTHMTSVAVRVCPCVSVSTRMTSVAVHQYTFSTLVLGLSTLTLPWTVWVILAHVGCLFSTHRKFVGAASTHRTSVAVRQHTQYVCGCPCVSVWTSVPVHQYTYQHAGPSRGLFGTHMTSVAVRVCPCVSVSTNRTSVAVHQYTYQHVGPWTRHADPSRGLFGTFMAVRVCPSAHTGRLWLSISTYISALVLGLNTLVLGLSMLALPVDCLGDFGPHGLSVQYTRDVRGTHKTYVAVYQYTYQHAGPWTQHAALPVDCSGDFGACGLSVQYTQDVLGCPSAHTGLHISARWSLDSARSLPVDCSGDFCPRGLSVQYTQDVRGFPPAHIGCPLLSVAVSQHTQNVRGCPCVSVYVRQHTQDVRRCPSVHISARWSLDSARWPFPWTVWVILAHVGCLFSTHKMFVGVRQHTQDHTQDVGGCPTVHISARWSLDSARWPFPWTVWHTQDVRGYPCVSMCVCVCPPEHTGRPWLSISTHISTLVLGLSTLALPWTVRVILAHVGYLFSRHRTSVEVRHYTQDVCVYPSADRGRLCLSVCVGVCPSAHRGHPWLSVSTHISTVLGLSMLTLPVDCSGDFGPHGLSVQYTQDVRGCPPAHTGRPWLSVNTHRTFVAVRVCPSAHIGRPWLSISTYISALVLGLNTLVLGLSPLAYPLDCLGDIGPRGLSVQYTRDVRGCPPAHTRCSWLSVSTHRTSMAVLVCPCVSVSTHRTYVAVYQYPYQQAGPWTLHAALPMDCSGDFGPRGLSVQYTKDVLGFPSAHTGRPWLSVCVRVCPCVSVSTHRTSMAVYQYTYQHAGPWTQHAALPVDCSGNFGPRGLSVQYTQAVRGCPSVHTGRPWLSVCVRVCPSAPIGLPWLYISTHISTLVMSLILDRIGRTGHGAGRRPSQLTGAGGLAQSAGNSWGSAPSSERCVLVRISVGESGTVTGRADGPGAGRFDQMGLRLGIGSGQAPRVMDLRQKDKEKAKEKEKEVAPGDRTPKVRGKDSLILRPWPDPISMKDHKWTVVREKHHEDRGHGKMCGDWVDSENCVIIVAYCATCELMRF
ncbi:hypothetical protein IGI04_042732 [Brassica rapa subsp. trilocularis]|uniref:Uncharacterized protein n=1 Tax=Brassica rapa subsp. trilocularis TaxID=1813537 RepID=A0ABQ7KLW3_BRACM|nr:hypothetical protein IGI04_042732 [Brassica rapa subsp. trilocularis]